MKITYKFINSLKILQTQISHFELGIAPFENIEDTQLLLLNIHLLENPTFNFNAETILKVKNFLQANFSDLYTPEIAILAANKKVDPETGVQTIFDNAINNRLTLRDIFPDNDENDLTAEELHQGNVIIKSFKRMDKEILLEICFVFQVVGLMHDYTEACNFLLAYQLSKYFSDLSSVQAFLSSLDYSTTESCFSSSLIIQDINCMIEVMEGKGRDFWHAVNNKYLHEGVKLFNQILCLKQESQEQFDSLYTKWSEGLINVEEGFAEISSKFLIIQNQEKLNDSLLLMDAESEENFIEEEIEEIINADPYINDWESYCLRNLSLKWQNFINNNPQIQELPYQFQELIVEHSGFFVDLFQYSKNLNFNDFIESGKQYLDNMAVEYLQFWAQNAKIYCQLPEHYQQLCIELITQEIDPENLFGTICGRMVNLLRNLDRIAPKILESFEGSRNFALLAEFCLQTELPRILTKIDSYNAEAIANNLASVQKILKNHSIAVEELREIFEEMIPYQELFAGFDDTKLSGDFNQADDWEGYSHNT